MAMFMETGDKLKLLESRRKRLGEEQAAKIRRGDPADVWSMPYMPISTDWQAFYEAMNQAGARFPRQRANPMAETIQSGGIASDPTSTWHTEGVQQRGVIPSSFSVRPSIMGLEQLARRRRSYRG
jgi:hypothetical protein